jgi:hypothetical protein
MEPAAHADFPWRLLGEVLVDQQLLTEDELEQALLEQSRTGRLLGQIVVNNGYLSAFSLARVLSEQHGVELRPAKEQEQQPPMVELSLADPPELGAEETEEEPTWRPLGKLLVEKGFLTESQLKEALAEQSERQARLGEILVWRGLLSGPDLARALAEQHGVELDPPTEAVETVIRLATADEPTYKVFEVGFEPGFQRRTEVFASPNFLEAADYAFEYVEDHEPDALEIQRTHGAAQETVWNYSASRAAAISEGRKGLVETFGFDPTIWGKQRR